MATQIPSRRLGDDETRAIAEGFVCDYISTRHKIARGELLAAQRWLHHQLADASFQLHHELRLRQGKLSLPDARRLEFLVDDRRDVTVGVPPNTASLETAVASCAASFRRVMHGLVGDSWRWPDGVR